MNFIKVNQTSLTTCPINKSIGYYQRLNPIILEDDFVSNLIIDKNEDQFIKSYIKYFTLARQSTLKAFYTIELEYLRYLINDLIEQYNIITFMHIDSILIQIMKLYYHNLIYIYI